MILAFWAPRCASSSRRAPTAGWDSQGGSTVKPSPRAIATRLVRTARDLGAPGYDQRYGWGLVKRGTRHRTTPP
jgi:hypothetical protein